MSMDAIGQIGAAGMGVVGTVAVVGVTANTTSDIVKHTTKGIKSSKHKMLKIGKGRSSGGNMFSLSSGRRGKKKSGIF